MTNKENVIWLFLAIFVAVFFYFILQGEKKINHAQTAIKTECVKTNLWVIGNKGKVARVYDCNID